MMIIQKACFSIHSQWPPKSFRLSPGLRASAVFSFLGCLRFFLLSYQIFFIFFSCFVKFINFCSFRWLSVIIMSLLNKLDDFDLVFLLGADLYYHSFRVIGVELWAD
ncbi:hypothetical protein ABFX02_08G230800 [Erythranthe guttata]